ncbi:MAG: glycosyltransferase family 39 protein [candidate division WOR-3 bacterium]
MSLAQSILHKNYKVEAFIGTPPEVSVTPGFPLIMAASLIIFGRSFIPIKIFSFVCFLIALVIWYKLFNSQELDKRILILMILFAVLNPLIAEFSFWELTEASFMLMSSATILFFFLALQKNNIGYWIITAILAAGSFYIRAAGGVLPVAIGLTLVLQRKWKYFLVYTTVVVLIIMPWLIRFITIGHQVGGGIYTPQFITDLQTGEVLSISGFISKAFRNLSRYLFVQLPSLYFPIGQNNFATKSGLGIFIGLIFFMLIILGIIKNIRSQQNLYSVYVILTLLMLISFAEHAVLVRYLVVIYPFITILIILGLKAILAKIKQKESVVLGILLIITLLAIPSYFNLAVRNTRIRNEYIKSDKYAELEPNWLTFIEANEWLGKYDTTKIGVISRKPTLTWWFSGHQAKGYLARNNPSQVMADIDSSRAKYVIVDQVSSSTPQFLVPTIRAFPERFKILYVTKRPETYVLEIIKKDSVNLLTQ